MFIVKPVFLDFLSDELQGGTVKENFTYGAFAVVDESNVDRLIQILAARDNCVSVGFEQRQDACVDVVFNDGKSKEPCSIVSRDSHKDGR